MLRWACFFFAPHPTAGRGVMLEAADRRKPVHLMHSTLPPFFYSFLSLLFIPCTTTTYFQKSTDLVWGVIKSIDTREIQQWKATKSGIAKRKKACAAKESDITAQVQVQPVQEAWRV
jgi:hypothetical protein